MDVGHLIPLEAGQGFRLKSAGGERPSGRQSFGIPAVARSSDWVLCGELPAQRVALELDAVGVVDDAVEDGVCDDRLADQVMPAVDGYLAGDEGGAVSVAFLDDLQQVAALVGRERLEPP